MPINANIALGAQPQQPVNMLGQMGQAMALKAASQDIQGNEALREFYAQGGNASTPEGARALMAANPKMGMQILKNTAETQKIQGDALSKSFANAREGLSMVRTPEDLLNYSISQFSDPLIGPSLKARGLTPETVAANLQKELSTSGFDAVLKKSAMGLDGWYKDQTSRRNTDVSSGAGYQQAALAREKYDDQLKYGGDVVTTTIPDPENPKERIEIQTRRNIRGGNLIPLEVQSPPMRVDISPSSATSSYQPSGGGGGPNVLATQVAPQGGAAPVTNVNALNLNAPQAPVGTTFAMPKSKSENLTEYQGKSTAFAIRAKQAHEILNVVGKGGEVQPGLIKRGAEAIPFIGEGLGTALNFTQSDAQQQIEQAQRNFVNAVLRQESGAAINESEFNNAKKQYFPQPGDSAAVIEQKRLNREAAIQGFEVSAGPGAKKTTPPSAGPARIGSDSEFNALPSGAIFTAPDGTIRRKP